MIMEAQKSETETQQSKADSERKKLRELINNSEPGKLVSIPKELWHLLEAQKPKRKKIFGVF